MNLALGCFAEWNDPRIKPVNQRPQRKKIQIRILANIQPITHDSSTP
jgi:hypothetical protein